MRLAIYNFSAVKIILIIKEKKVKYTIYLIYLKNKKNIKLDI